MNKNVKIIVGTFLINCEFSVNFNLTIFTCTFSAKPWDADIVLKIIPTFFKLKHVYLLVMVGTVECKSSDQQLFQEKLVSE